MFRKFHKSLTFVIIKSLITSPAAICIYNISTLFIIIMTFYGIYLFNLYLINEKITLFSSGNTSESKAIILIYFELLGLCIIILLLFIIYFIVDYTIKCINDTKQKFIKDINEYECNSVTWQK